MFSYVSLEARIPADHPLRPMRAMVDEALRRLSRRFSQLYADSGRPSIAPERLMRALLLQVLYSIRSERQLMEQLEYDRSHRVRDADGSRRLRRAPGGARDRGNALASEADHAGRRSGSRNPSAG